MPSELPTPGNGYVVRERLGGGYWKEAFRGVSRLQMRDVALLVYRDAEATEQMQKDFAVLLRVRGAKYADYIANFSTILFGEDGRVYFVEELLARPLDRLAPMSSGDQFLRIARDLSRGLIALHSQKLVHRDLKLDNCGIDQSGRAKIFDLGSVTSEPGSLLGTILTRAPELFTGAAEHDKASDIWALGATLFALRTGSYPFVDRHEIERRRHLNEQMRLTKISAEEAEREKGKIDVGIEARYKADGAQAALIKRVHKALPDEPAEILCQMLDFRPQNRPTAEQCNEKWDSLASKWVTASERQSGASPAGSPLESYLNAVLAGVIAISDRQWDTVAESIGHLKQTGERDGEVLRLEGLAEKVKTKRLKEQSEEMSI